MGKIISLANQKGGVGKTTTAINLSTYLAAEGNKVLLIDIDPQGNAGSGLGLDVMNLKDNIYRVMIDDLSAGKAIQKTSVENLSIMTSNIDLAGLEMDLIEKDQKEFVLKNALGGNTDKYDYTIIDCPPSLGLLTINALTASDSVLIPLQCEYFALEGLTQLLRIINLVQGGLNPALELEGVLLTMYDSRTRLSASVVSDVREHFKDKVYDVIIPRNVKLSEAPSFGEPIGQYDPSSNGAAAYQSLAKEFIKKQ